MLASLARRSALVLVAIAATSIARTARASDGPDTAYGRIDGDISASAGLGTTFGPRGPRAAADLRVHYLWTAGLFATYEDGPLLGSSAEPRRAFATGVELRPLFFAKWLQGKELGNPYLDLTIDSFSLELGAVFLQPLGTSFASKPGLQAGIGIQVPIFPRATGPVVGLHGGARWSNSALAGRDIESATDRSLFLLVTVGWQQVFGGNIVDLGDRAP
jgi:hypothetical protein